MTLEKAIEEMKYRIHKGAFRSESDARIALNLGIEALKRTMDQKTDFAPGPFGLLPGETEE